MSEEKNIHIRIPIDEVLIIIAWILSLWIMKERPMMIPVLGRGANLLFGGLLYFMTTLIIITMIDSYSGWRISRIFLKYYHGLTEKEIEERIRLKREIQEGRY